MLTIRNAGKSSEVYDIAPGKSHRPCHSAHSLDRFGALMGLNMARILPADCCEDCGAQISSMRQIQHPGVDTCDRCSSGTSLPARSHNC